MDIAGMAAELPLEEAAGNMGTSMLWEADR